MPPAYKTANKDKALMAGPASDYDVEAAHRRLESTGRTFSAMRSPIHRFASRPQSVRIKNGRGVTVNLEQSGASLTNNLSYDTPKRHTRTDIGPRVELSPRSYKTAFDPTMERFGRRKEAPPVAKPLFGRVKPEPTGEYDTDTGTKRTLFSAMQASPMRRVALRAHGTPFDLANGSVFHLTVPRARTADTAACRRRSSRSRCL